MGYQAAGNFIELAKRDVLWFFLENENNELETLVRLLNDSEHVESANIVGAEQHDAEQDVKEEYIKIEVSD